MNRAYVEFVVKLAAFDRMQKELITNALGSDNTATIYGCESQRLLRLHAEIRSSCSDNNWLLSESDSDNNFLDTVWKSWNNPGEMAG